ncbi:MAG: hypothetical protein CBC78_000720 [Candidatus Pelagibacter sp. TMED118]|nr:MAG: hypothetical protein CBC78_000720 [Candidatus Pelagibacter sp. TMED118]|tara:strand:- start:1010 stop:2191 length:1182 start_codon:yes stop_codon:yes gene_type:complete
MNLDKILEYAIYHDNIEKKINLPGIKNGLPIESFFLEKTNFKLQDFEFLTKKVVNKSIYNTNNINLLCSGGVDSSLLVCFLNDEKKKFIGINNYYPNHKLNDLHKIHSLKKFQNFKIKKVKISSKNYIYGMNLSFKKNYFGNTYAPTLFYSINFFKNYKNRILMTGSGPDELFYGMEKYNLKFFKRLSSLKTQDALEKIDTNYNFDFYEKVLNSLGIELLNNVIIKRKLLYKKIAEINKDLLEAQRILAYCTVTNQHYEMFEKVSKSFNYKHLSPFLDKEYIKFAFSFKLKNFLNFNIKKNKFDANMGKHQLKELLVKYTSTNHAYSNKIGFHAPVSKMINEDKIINNLKSNLYLEKLEKIIDIDKLTQNLKKIKKGKQYNLYSLIGLQKMLT